MSGSCVHSPNYPLNYGSSETCTVQFNSDETLHVDDFATENNFDKMILDGTIYTGLTGPRSGRCDAQLCLVLGDRLWHDAQGMDDMHRVARNAGCPRLAILT